MVSEKVSATVIDMLTCEGVNIFIVASQIDTRRIFLDELDNLI